MRVCPTVAPTGGFLLQVMSQYTTQLKQRLSMFTGPGAVKVSTEHNLYFCAESM